MTNGEWGKARRPRIGINCDVDDSGGAVRLNWAYVEAIVRVGGVPVLLAPVAEPGWVAEALDELDGLLLTGGRDYDPALYGRAPHPATRLLSRRRMAFDLPLAHAALARRVPTLGVCGGAQLLNIALGGTLVQDIPDELKSGTAHQGQAEARHRVTVAAGTRLATIVGAGELEVSSSHHQAVEAAGEGLRIAARAPDGVIEAIEGAAATFLLGVQWHPERWLDRAEHLALFRALVEASTSAGRSAP